MSEWDEEDRHRQMSETLILGLRLDEGVSGAAFGARFGAPPEGEFGEPLGWGVSEGLVARQGDRLKLTERGILLSNELFERLL